MTDVKKSIKFAQIGRADTSMNKPQPFAITEKYALATLWHDSCSYKRPYYLLE